MFLKLTQNNATALWNPNCRVESVNGINQHIIRNSVRNSVFSRLCNISLTTFTKVLELIEGMFGTISEVFEKSSVLVRLLYLGTRFDTHEHITSRKRSANNAIKSIEHYYKKRIRE